MYSSYSQLVESTIPPKTNNLYLLTSTLLHGILVKITRMKGSCLLQIASFVLDAIVSGAESADHVDWLEFMRRLI
jgi:hypothetical protein